MNGNLCRDCGRDHPTILDALRCAEDMADACRCGRCKNCRFAAMWRAHPEYQAPPSMQKTEREARES